MQQVETPMTGIDDSWKHILDIIGITGMTDGIAV